MTNKLHTNFRFPKLDEVDEKDYDLVMFGIFIRTVERFQRKSQYAIERHRLRNEYYSCCICKSTETVRTRNGIKIWFKHNGQPICIYRKSRMRRQTKKPKRNNPKARKGQRILTIASTAYSTLCLAGQTQSLQARITTSGEAA